MSDWKKEERTGNHVKGKYRITEGSHGSEGKVWFCYHDEKIIGNSNKSLDAAKQICDDHKPSK